ncbi:MAG: hypothetical protein ABEH90_06615 [Halolamina sp.]
MADFPTRPLATQTVRMSLITALVGFTAGCWVGYVLVYPVSSLPLPKYTVVGVVVLGVYLDIAADTMLERLLATVGAGVVAYATGVVVYAFPAVVGWYTDPVVQRTLYLSGLRRGFIFALLAATLLLMGTFVSYIARNTYAEFTR